MNVPLLVIIIVLVVIILLLIPSCIIYFHSPHYIDNLKVSLYGTAQELPEYKNPGNKKVAVFMVATPEIDNYAQYTIHQNGNWAESMGYDFFVYDKKILKDLPINFSKIQYSLNLLETDKYDYVMYIDADAIVHRTDYDVRNLIRKYLLGPQSILFGEDCYSKKVCSKPGRINSGVFIVRNNIWGRQILKSWRDSARGPCSSLVNKFPNCQLIYSQCVFPKWFWATSIIPFNLINGAKDTLFIKHAMAMDDMQRIDEIKKVYQSSDRIQIF